jgi:hypothetical protein
MIYKRGCDKKSPNNTCSKCGDRGSCGVYWYKFMWQGKLIRESTKQGNDKVARNMESAHRTSLAKGEVGIREKKPSPTLNDFIARRFEPWSKARFENNVPKTWLWYRTTIRAVQKYKPLASAILDEITSEKVSAFAAHRQSLKMRVSSANNSLRALRRMLRLAVEWGSLVTQAESESAWNQTYHVATTPNPPMDFVKGKTKPPLIPGPVTEVVTVPASSMDS